VPPSLLLAGTLASIVGLLFHAAFGRRLWQLPLYWIVAIIGFLLGDILQGLSGITIARIGSVFLPGGFAGAALLLGLTWLLTTPVPESQTPAVRRPRRVRTPHLERNG